MHYPVPEGNFATRTGTSGAVGSPITGTGGGCDAGGGYGGGRYRGGYAIGGPAQAPAAARVEDMAVRRDPFVDGRRAATGATTCHHASPRHVLAPRVDVAGGVPLSMQAGRYAPCRKERGSSACGDVRVDGSHGRGRGGHVTPARTAWEGVQAHHSPHQADFVCHGGRRYVGTAVAPPPGRYWVGGGGGGRESCLLYTSPSPRDKRQSRMPSSA